ncbi:MAG TPA: YbhN family protein [Pseudonocardiaceae bacterium]|jgi:hypothetical protein|nr:YbhN family protein [Pseudonocardiaceae bacterium]
MDAVSSAEPGAEPEDVELSAGRPVRTGMSRRTKVVIGVITAAILIVELSLGWPYLASALDHLRTPRWGMLSLVVLAESISMGMFARMQRRLLHAAGTDVQIQQALALAYAAHSLSISLPGGPVFSTAFNFEHMQRFGASAAIASWCVALSSILSTAALAMIGLLAAFLASGSGGAGAPVESIVSVLAIAAVVRVIAQRPQWLARPAIFGINLVYRVLRKPVEQGRQWVESFVAQLSSVHMRSSDLRIATSWAIGNWALDAVGFGLSCLAVDAHHLSVSQLIIAYAAGMAASTIPLVPGGLGVVDGALILGLVAGRTPADDAIAAVVVYRLISWVLVASVGWVLWWFLRKSTRTEPAGTATT